MLYYAGCVTFMYMYTDSRYVLGINNTFNKKRYENLYINTLHILYIYIFK